MEKYTEIIDILSECNPEALTCDGFEEALVGICYRYGQPPIACYDYDKCLSILESRDGMTHEEATEYFDYNVIGAWVGESTPAFISLFDS